MAKSMGGNNEMSDY